MGDGRVGSKSICSGLEIDSGDGGSQLEKWPFSGATGGELPGSIQIMKTLPAWTLALSVLCTGGLSAKDWPHFRGPNGDNSLPDSKIATSFPKEGPKVLWSVDVSQGYGGAAISGDEVFFMDRVDQEKDVLTCVGLKDGKERWKFEHAVPGRIMHPGSRTVPTVEADAVYCSGGFGHVYCVDRKSGEKRWVLDVAKVFGAQPPRFGYAVHPIIRGDLCIIAPIGEAVGLVAVDKKTSKMVWKTGSIGDSHSSPVLVKLLGKEVVVMPGVSNGTMTVKGFNPKDGREVFVYREEIGSGRFNPIPNLTVVNTDTAVMTGGYGKGTRVLKFTENDGAVSVRKSGNLSAGATIHPPLKVGDRLYMTAGSGRGGGSRFGRFRGGRDRGGPSGRPGGRPGGEGSRPGGGGRPPGGGGQAGAQSQSGLIAMDSSGKIHWATGSSPALGGGSLINAGGIIVSQDGGDGTLRLIKPGAAYKELASGKVFSKEPGSELWAPLALANGKLVMRSNKEVVCVDLGVATEEKE